MRTCVIFNPTARGEKARRFRRYLDTIAADCVLKSTAAAGDARRLAAEAVTQGVETIVAAGGDGTLNEVLNGFGDVDRGFERARLGVLPLGTVNVFARELGLPTRLSDAWATVRRGRETRIDLPAVTYSAAGGSRTHHFAQLGGAGLDARAIELVDYGLKKKIGPLAYVFAGLKALCERPVQIQAAGGGHTLAGELVLLGNGRLYGGPYRVFPQADLRDGQLDVCVFPRVNWFRLALCGPWLVFGHRLPASCVRLFRAASVTLTAQGRMSVEVDGELLGQLPATFTVERERLRVIH